jgi:hypothetical protein
LNLGTEGVEGNTGNSSFSALVGLPLTKAVVYGEIFGEFKLEEVDSLRDGERLKDSFRTLLLDEVASEGKDESLFSFLDSAIAAILSQTRGPLLALVPPDRLVEDLITNTRADGFFEDVVIYGLMVLDVLEYIDSKAGKSAVFCNQNYSKQ